MLYLVVSDILQAPMMSG